MTDYKATYTTALNDLLDAHITSKTVKTIDDVYSEGESSTNPVSGGALYSYAIFLEDELSKFLNTVTKKLNAKIETSGGRGTLAGYESVTSASTVNSSSSDSLTTNSDVTVENGTSGTAWTKIVSLTNAVTVTLGSSWTWRGGTAPTIVANGILVCCWCGSFGIATFVSPSA